MADTGIRSVEVNVSNMTDGDMTIQSPQAQTGSWIKGEEPTNGDTLSQLGGARWGVMTNDSDSSASGRVVLSGYGPDFPISFSIDRHGNKGYNITNTSSIEANCVWSGSGEASHPVLNVTLSSA